MHRLFDVPRPGIGSNLDILGAIFFDQKRIVMTKASIPARILPMKDVIITRRPMNSGTCSFVAPCSQKTPLKHRFSKLDQMPS